MQTLNLLIAKLFYPETFPAPLFGGAWKCGALVLLIAASIAGAMVLS